MASNLGISKGIPTPGLSVLERGKFALVYKALQLCREKANKERKGGTNLWLEQDTNEGQSKQGPQII